MIFLMKKNLMLMIVRIFCRHQNSDRAMISGRAVTSDRAVSSDRAESSDGGVSSDRAVTSEPDEMESMNTEVADTSSIINVLLSGLDVLNDNSLLSDWQMVKLCSNTHQLYGIHF